MSGNGMKQADLETRVDAVIEAAKAEQQRWQPEVDGASDEAQQVLASTHLAASSAVLSVLQEVLDPGTHSE